MDVDPSIQLQSSSRQAGLLSRTLFQSPLVIKILTGRLRQQDQNDVVFVSSTHLYIKQKARDDHFHNVASLSGLGRHILDAVVIGKRHTVSGDQVDVKVKQEEGAEEATSSKPAGPPEILVLLLEQNELAFLELYQDAASEWKISVTTRPLPRPGRSSHHTKLVVDPYSRAMAAITIEGVVSLCQLRRPLPPFKTATSCVVSLKMFSVPVPVILADFVFPTHNLPEIHLLLIGGLQGTYHSTVLSWEAVGERELRELPVHKVRLNQDREIPTMLIPLAATPGAFVVAFETYLAVYRNAHIGEIARTNDIPNKLHMSSSPARRSRGESRNQRFWTCWARAPRWFKHSEVLYICREDGIVHSITMGTQREFHNGDTMMPPAPPDMLESSKAADLGGNISGAFALYDPAEGIPDAPRYGGDTLLYMGTNCDGAHYEVTPKAGDGDHFPLVTTIRDIFHNWVPFGDMTQASLTKNGNALVSDEGRQAPTRVFATSGSGHAGALSELRFGCEVKLAYAWEQGDFHLANNIWTLKCSSYSWILYAMSFPTETRVLGNPDGHAEDMSLVEDFEGASLLFSKTQIHHGDQGEHSLAQYSDFFVRVTHSSVAIFQLNFATDEESILRPHLSQVAQWHQDGIQTAAIDALREILVLTTIDDGGGSRVQCCEILQESESFTLKPLGEACCLVASPIAAKIVSEPVITEYPHIKKEDGSFTQNGSESLIAISTAEAQIILFSFSKSRGLQRLSIELQSMCTEELAAITLPQATEIEPVCESLEIVPMPMASKMRGSHRIYCGTRDGHLVIYEIHASPQKSNVRVSQTNSYAIGNTPVRVTVDRRDEVAILVCCDHQVLYADGNLENDEHRLVSMYFTDRNEQAFAQPSISILQHVESSDNRLVAVTNTGFLMANFNRYAEPLPRRITVPATPKLVLWSQCLNKLIVTSEANVIQGNKRYQVTGLTIVDPDARVEPGMGGIDDFSGPAKPTIQFDEQGVKVTSMAEWDCHGFDKRRQLLLVATSVEGQNNRIRGCLNIVSFSKTSSGSRTLRLKPPAYNESGPVTALSVFDPHTIVYCVRNDVYMRRVEEPGNEERSALRFSKTKLGETNSPGKFTTCKPPYVCITTETSSTQIYRLVPETGTLTLLVSDHSARDGIANYALLGEKLFLSSAADSSVVGLRLDGSVQDGVAFDARLTRPIVRFTSALIKPSYRRSRDRLCGEESLIGTSPDGALLHFQVLSKVQWHLLGFVQNICLRNTRISIVQPTKALNRHVMPDEEDATARHVDGDVLQRLLEQDEPERVLREMLNAPVLEDELSVDFERAEDRFNAFVNMVQEVRQERVQREDSIAAALGVMRELLQGPF